MKKDLRKRIADTPDKRSAFDDDQPTVADFIEKHGLYLDCQPIENWEPRDDWDREASHWTVKLKSTVHKGKYKTHYHMGAAHVGEPKIEGFLESTSMDISIPHFGYDFHEFCSNCGYDEDSIKAHEIWDLCCDQCRKLNKFLGPAAVEQLLCIEW